jgi:integrase
MSRKALPGMVRHHKRWRVQKAVPPALQAHFGTSRFFLTLEERDEVAAYIAARPILAEWQTMLVEAKLNPKKAATLRWRQVYNRNRTVQTPQAAINLDDIAIRVLQRLGGVPAPIMNEVIVAKAGQIEQAAQTLGPASVTELRQIVGQVAIKTPFTKYLCRDENKPEQPSFEEYATTKKGQPYHPDSMRNIKQDVRMFEAEVLIPQGLGLEDMDGENARLINQTWLEELGKKKGIGTAQGKASHLSLYWQWMAGRLDQDRRPLVKNKFGNPFKGLKASGAKPETVPPYQPEDICRVVRTIQDYAIGVVLHLGRRYKPDLYTGMWQSFLIAAFTGMRRASVALLLKSDIREVAGCLVIHCPEETGKTIAGERDIPVHPIIRPLIEYLMANARPDGRLFVVREKGGGWSVALGKLITRMGLDAKLHPYHSTRHSFSVMLDGIDTKVLDNLMGHVVKNRARGHGPGKYGTPSEIKILMKGIMQLKYPGITPAILQTDRTSKR